jgi:hypothetical protein
MGFYAKYPPSYPAIGAVSTVQGEGTPGTPVGGVLSVQGVVGGTPLFVSGFAGQTSVFLFANNYTTTPVNIGSYLQLVASTTMDVNNVIIWDSSGAASALAVGPAGSEVNQVYFSPGGIQSGVPIFIPAGSRVSLSPVTANATSGDLLVTGLK